MFNEVACGLRAPTPRTYNLLFSEPDLHKLRAQQRDAFLPSIPSLEPISAPHDRHNLDTILSQLPNISLPEFNFVHSSFLRRPDGADAGYKLPSPQQEVLGASGPQPRRKGVWRFPERGFCWLSLAILQNSAWKKP